MFLQLQNVVLTALREQVRAQIEARDLELINKAADELNVEVEDILRYQQT
jgi:hypothetical protein